MNATRRGFLGVFLTVGLTAACADGPTAPGSVPVEAEQALVTAGDHVRVIERERPLADDLSVTRTIGLLGGTIAIPEAGLSVLVPAGAVMRPTTITIVAPAGALVGYHFFPEGLSFALPLVAVQNLSGTNAPFLGSGLLAAHFEGALSPEVEALELLPLSLLQSLGTFSIPHFSGYVVATN